MAHNFTEDDEGKRVVDAEGDEIGRVVEVSHGTAYVDPDPGLTDAIMSKLGWSDADEDSYPLQENAVGEVADDEIRLSRF
ncbi:PRC-barrel domain containing protein [Halegenticoccus tardaugens]|uniref:PRC-barrel domain containing protein n=1 Tax=Halegenticoccus tardaugens TaxID=2071624 RepID=UPI00100AEC21|nr:PRC-barrel domain containing protein [Halegenticoccus tardaugens]